MTEKLLTGFDAPILYCLYLDKPMRDHTLLQAIARVNRPYEREGELRKPAGFVLDFVGMFERLEKALAFDSDVVGSVVRNLDVLKERFARLMAERAPEYLALCEGYLDDKAVERAIEAFGEKSRRETFYRLVTEIETLYEIISPDVLPAGLPGALRATWPRSTRWSGTPSTGRTPSTATWRERRNG